MFVFLPIGDEPNDHVRRPIVTWGLIALNVGLMAIAYFGRGSEADIASLYKTYGWTQGSSSPLNLVTHLFVHDVTNWMHVLGNMLFLWIFGDNVESRLGHLGFLAAYLAVGAAAALVQGALDSSGLPLVGASGAVSGVQGLYFVACPGARVRLFAWVMYFVRVVLVPARLIMAVWFLLQDVLPVVLASAGIGAAGDSVGHWAHLGGFAAGMLLMLGLLPLLGRNDPPPRLSIHQRYSRRLPPPLPRQRRVL